MKNKKKKLNSTIIGMLLALIFRFAIGFALESKTNLNYIVR